MGTTLRTLEAAVEAASAEMRTARALLAQLRAIGADAVPSVVEAAEMRAEAARLALETAERDLDHALRTESTRQLPLAVFGEEGPTDDDRDAAAERAFEARYGG